MNDAELDPHGQALVSLIAKQEPKAVFWTKHYWADEKTYAVEVFLLDGAERAENSVALGAALAEVDQKLVEIERVSPDGGHTAIYAEEAREIIAAALEVKP